MYKLNYTQKYFNKYTDINIQNIKVFLFSLRDSDYSWLSNELWSIKNLNKDYRAPFDYHT